MLANLSKIISFFTETRLSEIPVEEMVFEQFSPQARAIVEPESGFRVE
jgi:hypothetical protein